MKKLIVIIVALLLTGCASITCRVGLGLDYGERSLYVHEVFEGSPAEKAGVRAGGRVDPIESTWPPSGKAGESSKLVVHYGKVKKTYNVTQERMCFEAPGIW